jgi:hypothetical protein
MGDFDSSVGSNKRLPRFSKEELAMRCEARAARGAVKQRTTNLPLKIRDLLTDRGLRDVELTAGFTEAAVIGDRTEVAQVSQLHDLVLQATVYRLFRWTFVEIPV